MRRPIVFGSLLVTVALHPCVAEIINFDHAPRGSVPPGWTIAMTHQGGPPKWEVI